MNLDKFLKSVDEALPPICTDRDLVEKIPTIFKNPVYLCRLRKRNDAPAFFRITKGRVTYLKADVIAWIKKSYNEQSDCSLEYVNDSKA